MPTSLLSPSRFFHLAAVSNPHCVGIFDAGSRSVWVVNKQDRDLLWQRGFFGKGNLSRSEPSWLKRRINQLEAERGTNKGEVLTTSIFVPEFVGSFLKSR